MIQHPFRTRYDLQNTISKQFHIVIRWPLAETAELGYLKYKLISKRDKSLVVKTTPYFSAANVFPYRFSNGLWGKAKGSIMKHDVNGTFNLNKKLNVSETYLNSMQFIDSKHRDISKPSANDNET